MAYRQEKNNEDVDIVIDGFEKGIADSPEQGIADMRNMNITSVPNEAAVQFSTAGLTLPQSSFGTVPFTVTGVTTDYLVAGGGGAGGASSAAGEVGGGGGAGRVLTGTTSLFIASYAVTVGAGGTGTATTGNSGASSVLGTIATATGGGGGGKGTTSGANGGNGGGGGAATTGGNAGGTGTDFNGGAGVHGTEQSGGGGGGAGAIGAAGTGSGGGAKGGDGGVGVSSSISGAATFYGGGGGGASTGAGGQGAGGSGGGGAGNGAGAGGNATANTGGGGGGSSQSAGNHNGGNGGSGVVIVSYTTGVCTATGGTITTSGGKTIHTFTSDGTFAISAITGYTPNTMVVASTAGYTTRMAIVIVTSTVTGITVGSTYYIDDITATTFKLYNVPLGGSAVALTSPGSGTFTVPSFGTPVDSVAAPSISFVAGTGQNYTDTFVIDNTGNVWFIGNGVSGGLTLNQVYYVGNSGHTTLTATGSLGIGAWRGYLFTFIQDQMDYIKVNLWFASGPSNWVYHWQDIQSSEAGHKTVSATDNVLYFCNGQNLGSLLEEDGATFDPTNTATYAYTEEAITQGLPAYDLATCIAQLGTKLLIGGIQNYVYPWDRISPSFNYPLIVPEFWTHRIISTNQNAYLFSGTRGRIYITNGANMQIYKKMPDSLAGTETPLYTWGDTLYLRNQIYFGVTARTTAGTTISNFAGVWAIDIDSQALRMENSLSTGSYAGSVPVLQVMGEPYPTGNGYYIGWINGSGTGGIDYTLSTPYTTAVAYIDTDIIPVGTYYTQKTFEQIEFKLSKPLVTGESVAISWRSDLNTTFTAMTLTEGGQVGDLSGVFKANFQKVQWVQFRVISTSTATTPSYVPLRELRLR